MVARCSYALDAGLQATVTPLGPQVGPLLHISNRAADDTRPGLLILGHSDTVHPIGTLQQNPAAPRATACTGRL